MYRVKSGVIYCRQILNTVHFAFCPTREAWGREMKRLGVPDRERARYPETGGYCIHLEKDGEPPIYLIAIADDADKQKPITVAALLVHEATHVWQGILRYMNDDERPSSEFEAWSMQDITFQLFRAYDETRTPLFNNSGSCPSKTSKRASPPSRRSSASRPARSRS